MGDLVRTPHSEITATLEILDVHGVKTVDLDRFRRASTYFHSMVAKALIDGRESFFTGLKPSILPIDRSTPFDPAKLIGKGWSIWKGPADGDGLTGEEGQDQRSLALTEVDLSKIMLRTSLKNKKETYIKGEETLNRLKKAKCIRLDAQVFLTLWKDQNRIPASFKELTNGNTTFIFFDGAVLRGPDGYRYALCLYFSGVRWGWCYGWLDLVRYANDPSAVVAS